MSKINARHRLIDTVSKLFLEKCKEIEQLKQKKSCLNRTNFIWHYILQSFATWGRASGWNGLIGNKNNYQRIAYNVLNRLSPKERKKQIQDVFRKSNIRWPNKKAKYIFDCVTIVRQLGGLKAAKTKLLAKHGREAKINFLKMFPGIGPKYARNIMMDVYHKDFRNSIAIDVRIKNISKTLGLSFPSYEEHEAFYLQVAYDAGISGWELDRLLFNFYKEIKSMLELKKRK